MRPPGSFKRVAPLGVAVVLALGAPGCQLAEDGDNLVAGKTAFVAKCGSCHVLARAGTTGVTGPNLDEAFQQARKDGFKESTFAGLVHRQIQNPARNPQVDPKTGKTLSAMPADLVEGEAARDVAAYVATAVGKKGKDGGQLADIGVKRSTEKATAEGGVLQIPADPGGALAYQFGSAEAEAGALELDSQNDSQIPHNIALEGAGIDEQGPLVQGGGVSKVSVDVQPGEYTFYCSVPGHREGGMEGPLTVK
jgi:mono/diheme cytochrome c family protein